jgi:hypothetical protein
MRKKFLSCWTKRRKRLLIRLQFQFGEPMHDITSSLTSMMDNSDVDSCGAKKYFDTKPFLSFLKVDNSPLVPRNRGPTSATAKANDDTTSTSSLSANDHAYDDSSSSLSANDHATDDSSPSLSANDYATDDSSSSLSTNDHAYDDSSSSLYDTTSSDEGQQRTNDDDSSSDEGQLMQFQPGSFFSYDFFSFLKVDE